MGGFSLRRRGAPASRAESSHGTWRIGGSRTPYHGPSASREMIVHDRVSQPRGEIPDPGLRYAVAAGGGGRRNGQGAPPRAVFGPPRGDGGEGYGRVASPGAA